MNTFTKWFDDVLDSIQAILMSILVKIGPFFVALCPASFTAYAIYKTFQTEAGHNLALFFAIVVGIAWEAVGIISTHTATDLYNAAQEGKTQPVKFWLMVCLIPVYVIGVAAVVGFSQDAFTPLVKGLGVASPFLTCVVYVAVALARDIHQTESKQEQTEDKQAQIEAQERAWQHEKERLELELKHQERLARIEAKSRPSVGAKAYRPTPSKSSKMDNLNAANAARQADKEKALEAVLTFVTANPNASLSEIGQAVGKAKSTVGNYVNELTEAGRLHRNGNGWEVSR